MASDKVKAIKNTLDSLGVMAKQLTTSIREAQEQLKKLENEIGGKKRAAGSSDSDDEICSPSAKITKTTPASDSPDGVKAYTHGCCFNNGKHGTSAGIGVFWGVNDSRNVSERLDGAQTNKRAEIYAALRAIEQAKASRVKSFSLYTDSEFLHNCVTKWMVKWRKNGWKTSQGEDVKNSEDLKLIAKELDADITVHWVHIPGRKGEPGIEEADKLANQGARKPLA